MSNFKSQIYLALDPGLSKTGVAISFEGKLVEPLTTLESQNLINQIKSLIEKHHPDEIVVGEPSHGPIRDLSISIQDEIKQIFAGPVILHPEDLTSQLATQKMHEADTPKQKREAGNHAIAAAIILQDYLDSLQG